MKQVFPIPLIFLTSYAFCQLSVVSGRGPVFPDTVDETVLSIKAPQAQKQRIPRCDTLSKDFYGEFKQSIDSTFPYVDAVRLKRKEITGNTHGPKFTVYLKFSADKKQICQVRFSGNNFASGMLDIAADKYPYVVVFKPALAKKLRTEYEIVRSKKF